MLRAAVYSSEVANVIEQLREGLASVGGELPESPWQGMVIVDDELLEAFW